jgi:hypothetical protein
VRRGSGAAGSGSPPLPLLRLTRELQLTVLGSGHLSCRDLGRLRCVAGHFSVELIEEAARLAVVASPVRDWMPRREGEKWLRVLRLLEPWGQDRPLRFDRVPPGLRVTQWCCGHDGECDGRGGHARYGTVTKREAAVCCGCAVQGTPDHVPGSYRTCCSSRVMRVGIHRAEFEFRAGKQAPEEPRGLLVGVVRAGYDPTRPEHASQGAQAHHLSLRASDTKHGLGLFSIDGEVNRHGDWVNMAHILDTPGLGRFSFGLPPFTFGDRITLELDVEQGILSAWKNTIFVGVVATELSDPSGWCWSAELTLSRGDMVGISHGIWPLDRDKSIFELMAEAQPVPPTVSATAANAVPKLRTGLRGIQEGLVAIQRPYERRLLELQAARLKAEEDREQRHSRGDFSSDDGDDY